MNNKILKLTTIFTLTLSLCACNKAKNVSLSNNYQPQEESKYQVDDTTEVLLDDSNIDKDEIVKVIQHGDHWHVFTKDGKEHITYTDPNSISSDQVMEMVSVVSLDQLKGMNVKEIKVHGNHWHVFTEDGSEYLTYDNPKDAFPNIKITKYEASHEGHKNSTLAKASKTVKFHESKNKLNSDEVVKILKHEDHYHVYTASGKEFITYEDPSSMYPGIKVGTYTGSHGKNQNSSVKNKNLSSSSANNVKINKNLSAHNIEFISTISGADMKNLDVGKILKHGDHYHIYTKDGREYISYDNPQNIFPNINIGTYVGSHKSNRNSLAKGNFTGANNLFPNTNANTNFSNNNIFSNPMANNLANAKNNLNDPNRVVKILKHEDHYHVYTASGQEFITYEDPRAMYPNATFGMYQGSHAPLNGGTNNGNSGFMPNLANNNMINPNYPNYPNYPSLPNYPNYPNYPSYPNYPGENPQNPNNFFIKTIGLGELSYLKINKIKKHGDHYHIYDLRGNEYISYVNLGPIGSTYRDVVIEKYVGSHGHNDNVHNNESDSWPKGVTKIVDHGDHWHLYVGEKEVGIVRVNPKNIYPNAEYIKEYIDHTDVEVNDNDMFSYGEVPAQLKKSVLAYLDENLQKMTNFGNINSDLPVYGSNGQRNNVFYWLHGSHYHAISIKQIIQNAKAGVYGGNSARDVVATLKYLISHKNIDIEEEKPELSVTMEEAISFLRNHYGPDASISNDFGQSILVSKNDEDKRFNLADFDKVNGVVIYKRGKLEDFKKTIKADGEIEKKENIEKFPEDKKEVTSENKNANQYNNTEIKADIN